MAHITLLSSVLSFFLIAISADVQDIMVNKFHIDIDLYPESVFYVRCYFVFKNFRTTQEISMYTDEDKDILRVHVFKKDTGVNLYKSFNINSTTKILTVFLKEEIEPGFYVMKYLSGNVFPTAFNQVYTDRIHEKEIVWLSFSHFQPIWIQRIIPCWVRPKEDTPWLDMPTFNLSISHFAHHSVLTNMPIREERERDEKVIKLDMKRTYFDITPRMSPYQLSIVVTNFIHVIIDEDDVVSMWCRNRSASSLHFALTIAKNITTYLHLNKKWLRWRFSPIRVKLIVIPNYSKESFPEQNDSLVHPGIIIANEDDITYNEENDSVGRKYNVIRLIGYEVMREYYEWIVNPYWEPSTWLSKGFATFIATHIFSQALPNLRMMDLFVVQIQHECLDFDVDNSMLPFPHQNKTIPVEIIDNMKASVILRMLQHASDAEAFWDAIDTFTYESIIRNKQRHLKHFWETLKDAHDEKYKGTYNLSLLYPWIEGKGYPVLTVIRNYATSKSTMNLSIEHSNVWSEKRPIPVTYATRTNLNFNRTLPLKWLRPPYGNPLYVLRPVYRDWKIFKYTRDSYTNRHFPLNENYREDSWFIFNIQQTGYYRVNYDDENWARISTYLNTEDYLKIHVLNRAQLIDDAFQFMLLGKLKADVFWQLTKYLERETDYIAWYPMFKAIEYMSTSFQFYEESYFIMVTLARILNTLLRNINLEEQHTDDDFTKALRQEAVRLACYFKMYKCAELASYLLKHLETKSKLTPWWKKLTYCYGFIEANNIIWHQTLNKIRGNDNDKISYLITCPNHLVKINNLINDDVKSRITPSTKVQFELKHFVYTIVESLKKDEKYNDEMKDDKSYKNHTIFVNLLHNFADIKPRQLKLSTAILIVFNNIYSIDYLDDVWHAFVFKGILESHILKKLQVRKGQLENHYSLFERIKPRN